MVTEGYNYKNKQPANLKVLTQVRSPETPKNRAVINSTKNKIKDYLSDDGMHRNSGLKDKIVKKKQREILW